MRYVWATNVRGRWVALALGVMLLGQGRAHAEKASDDEEGEGEGAPAAEPSDDAAAKASSDGDSGGDDKVAADRATKNGPLAVDWHDPRAFPEKYRGITGGSLWLEPSSWATQWPYMPRTGILVSGAAWVDTGYEQITRGDNQVDTKYLLQQGRGTLRFTPTLTTDTVFLQGQAELIANKDQTVRQPDVADVDDLWVRIGVWDKWDVTLGRFQAWEVYHLGMGLDLNTLERRGAVDTKLSVPELYGLTDLWDRPSGAGNVALHLFPSDSFRLEALARLGNDSGFNSVGGRLAAILIFGPLRIKAGAEARYLTPQNDVLESSMDANGNPIQVHVAPKESTFARGAGGSIQVVLKPNIEFGLNAARQLVDHHDASSGGLDPLGSFTRTSFGGFVNARATKGLLVGAGVNWTSLVDLHVDLRPDSVSFNLADSSDHLQAFGAVQLQLAGSMFIKVVGAYARGHLNPSFEPDVTTDLNYYDTMVSGRVRFLYLF